MNPLFGLTVIGLAIMIVCLKYREKKKKREVRTNDMGILSD